MTDLKTYILKDTTVDKILNCINDNNFEDISFKTMTQNGFQTKNIIDYFSKDLLKEILQFDDFDKKCLEVDLSIDTDNPELDSFFRKEFDPSTGQWIHKHPEKRKIGYLLEKYYNVKNN